MRRRLTLDAAVNVLLALTCVVVLAKYGYEWWLATHLRPSTAMHAFRPGERIPGLSGTTRNDRNLVIFASSACHFCTDSMPFYQGLSKQAHDAGLRLIAVGTEPRDVLANYFRSHSVTPDDVLSASPETTHVVATPTIAIVDKAGIVLHSWVGRLSAEAEGQVRAAVAAR